MAKKIREQELGTDVLELIVNKLSFADAVRFSAVCSSWRFAAKSSGAFSRQTFLTIPGKQTPTNPNPPQLFSLAEKNLSRDFHNALASRRDQFAESQIIGSSKERLLLLHGSDIVLISPFSQQTFRVPLEGLQGSDNAERVKISKAVVLNLSIEKNNLILVVIFGLMSRRIGFCRVGFGPGPSWEVLGGARSRYEDVVCVGRRLYALSEMGWVEAWRFDDEDSFPAKTMGFYSTEGLPRVGICGYDDDKYFQKRYLVKSRGELLVVSRLVGYHVNADGDLLSESDLLTDEDTHPLVCPYRTVEFRVYKACLGKWRRWARVESLGDERALFVGGSESMSVSCRDFVGCEGNSIYFTDDNWDGMNSDYLFGGHDMGVYSLEKNVVKSFYELDDEKVNPPPFWMVPNSV